MRSRFLKTDFKSILEKAYFNVYNVNEAILCFIKHVHYKIMVATVAQMSVYNIFGQGNKFLDSLVCKTLLAIEKYI